MAKIYPDAGVELPGFLDRNYDWITNIGTLGLYRGFIKNGIERMDIQPDDHILDLGCGTGLNDKLMCSYLGEEGHITGLDISKEMERQFHRNLKDSKCAEYIEQRVDIPFDLQKSYDKVFVCFVIHGFPQEVREVIIRNAYHHLKQGGRFFILDYAEFDMDAMPWPYRLFFKAIECKYAFDFIERDWKANLQAYGFDSFVENFFVKGYVRLLSAEKRDSS